MKNFRATDYNEYNKKLGLFKYGYLHRLLDLLFKVCKFYNLKHDGLIFWESDTGNQAELKNTMYLDLKIRIKLHKKILKELLKQRHKRKVIKQLKLF